MITNFALSLSFEGIELLHRVQRGWRRIGRADVASETLEADLADLRKKAQELAPDGLATKLIIPLDQIKYTAIDSTLTTQSDIDAKLEGATPYALDELVIDCERFGGRTHIAAVARETLKEAEVFAAAHGFNPVSFVAVPEPFTFQKEVFFGPTEMMPSILGPDAKVQRDELAVMIVGTRIKSRLLVFDLPEEVEEEVYKDDLTELLSGSFKPAVTPQSGPPDEAEENRSEDAPEVVTASVEAIDETRQDPAETEAVDEDDAPAEEVVAAPVQAIWVDHIPAEYHAPKVAEVAVAPEESVTEEIEIAPVSLIPKNPNFFVPVLFDSVIAEVHPQSARAPKAALRAAPDAGSINAPKLGVVTPTVNRSSTPTPKARSKTPLIVAIAASIAVIVGGVIWSQQQAFDAPTSQQTNLEADVATAIAENIATAPVEPAIEPVVIPLEAGPVIPEITITGFGVDDTDGGTLPVFADVSAIPMGEAPAQTLFAAPDQPLAALDNPPAPEPQPTPEVAQASVGAPILRGTVLSPADAERIYAATGVWQRSPRFLDVPSGIIGFDFLAPESYEAPSRVTQPQVPPLTGLETDLSFIAPADPPPATAVFARDDAGFIQATPEGTLTPDGALVIAGLPDLIITPRPQLTQQQLSRMALLAPAPEGVDLIAGRPDVIPPLRPANAQLPVVNEEIVAQLPETEPADEAADQLTPGSVGLAGLELQNDGSLALDSSVVEDISETDLRPLLRPQELASAVDPGTPDITDIIAGLEIDDATLRFDSSTRLAVVLSVRPDLRPSNFETTVAAAQARLVTTPTVTTAAPAPVTAAAPVPPQDFGPVPGGVARAATQEDVIRLRDINLIGVYGRPNARRALVRLSNGSYVRVEIGSALDGGQVTAIGDDALNYVKRGRTYAIELPSG